MKGFVESGRLGIVAPGQRLGAIPVPIRTTAADRGGCPLGYVRNEVGVCILAPLTSSGSGPVWTAPFVLGGRWRK